MKLLQWNIWYKEDVKNILKTLKELDPDIICLQEVTLNHSEFNIGVNTPQHLGENLQYNFFFKEAVNNPLNTFGNAIYSRYPIIQSNFSFIQNPEQSDEALKDYSSEPRVYVECLIDTGSKRLSVGTTHMSYTDKFGPTPAKKTESDKLLEILSKKTDNFIFTGDLNSLPDSYTITEIQKYLTHTGPAFEENTWTTKPFSYNGFEATTLNWRLDYCFASRDVQIKSAQVVHTPFSDHLPILIEF